MQFGKLVEENLFDLVYLCGHCHAEGTILEPRHDCNGDKEVCAKVCPVGDSEVCPQCLGLTEVHYWKATRPHIVETTGADYDHPILQLSDWPEQYDRACFLRAVRKKLKAILGDDYSFQVLRGCSFERGYCCPDPKGEYATIQCDHWGRAYSRLNQSNTDYYQAPRTDVERCTYIDTRGEPFP